MSTIFSEKIFTFIKLFCHIIAFYRTSRAFSPILSISYNKCRPVISFFYSSCNNASYTFMTVRKIYNKHLILCHATAFYKLYSLSRFFLCHLFTFIIKQNQFLCHIMCFIPILTQHKFNSFLCCIKTSTCIKTRTNHKTYMI